ncbi:hypothetical protein EGJ30_00835 [Stutzerimonas stutzeri]|nr:hypothetical protein EGJ30_00835 [Stutzerimonas stutzeri]
MAGAIEEAFDTRIREHLRGKAQRIRQTPLAGTTEWPQVHHDTEPQTNFWKRASVSFLPILPIEWML